MPKHDEDMGGIDKKNIGRQPGLVCVDSTQQKKKKMYIQLKNTSFVSVHADQLCVEQVVIK
jgi:hypothetical protein